MTDLKPLAIAYTPDSDDAFTYHAWEHGRIDLTWVFIETPYDRIAEAVARDDLDGGVLIHEEFLHFPELGLREVKDLGKAWCLDTGLPLPVGLNLVHRRLGTEVAEKVAAACRESLPVVLREPGRGPDLCGEVRKGKGQAPCGDVQRSRHSSPPAGCASGPANHVRSRGGTGLRSQAFLVYDSRG